MGGGGGLWMGRGGGLEMGGGGLLANVTTGGVLDLIFVRLRGE